MRHFRESNPDRRAKRGVRAGIKGASRPPRAGSKGSLVAPRLSTIAAFLGGIALSQRASAEEPIEVVVRGDSAPAFVSRASDSSSPRAPTDAASILASLPAVHVRRLGAEGAFASISVRGSASSQVAVTLGGIPLVGAADPSIDLGALPLWPGASFKVYRGFAPSWLGTTGYLGGVLAIEPPSPASGDRAEVWAALGSFGTQKLRLGDRRRVGDVDLGAGFFASRSDGDFTYSLGDLATGKITDKPRGNAWVRSIGAIERVAVERPWGSITGLVLGEVRRQGVPGDARAPYRSVSLERSRIVAGAEASIRAGSKGFVKVSAWGRRETSNLEDPDHELDPTRATSVKSRIEAGGLLVGATLRPVTSLMVRAIADGRIERFIPIAGVRFIASEPGLRVAGGIGTDLEFKPKPWVSVAASLRVDARRDTSPIDARPSSGAYPTGHAGVSLRLHEAAVLSAHAGSLARPPSFQELYGDGAALVGDPGLLPERSASFDLGLAGAIRGGGVAFAYEVVGFGSEAFDLITFVPQGRATFRAVNVARARILGAEVSASLAALGIVMQVSYTALHTENRSEDPLVLGKPLPGRPAHDLAYDASYRAGPFGIRYGLDVVAGTALFTQGGLGLPARVMHGAGASFAVPETRGLKVAIDVENLFDLRVQYVKSELLRTSVPLPVSDFLGFPLPGRTLWITARWTYEAARNQP